MKHSLPALVCALALLAGCNAPAAETPPPAESNAPAGTALTQEEIDRVNEAFAPIEDRENMTCATAASCFFTSFYERVEDLDFQEFMRYFPDDGTLGPEDEDEFAALAACHDLPFPPAETGTEGSRVEDLPVPVHRIRRETVDAALTRYAGITTAELEDTGGVLYLKDYDAFYTFTSDFGPGDFPCVGGAWDENGARLWTRPREDGSRSVLTLRAEDGKYFIQSFTQEAGPTLVQLLSGLTGEDISLSWTGMGEQAFLNLLRAALDHPIDHAPMTLNGSATDIVWSMDLYVAPQGQPSYSGDDGVCLYAGLEENVVEISGGANLPEGRIYLADEALYQLIRTSCDTPRDVDQEAYAACKALTDAYYDARLAQVAQITQDGPCFTRWELWTFREAGASEALNAKAYAISAAFSSDPPEEAVHLGAGGMYVDSALRAHGLDWKLTWLVTLDGQPAGVLRLPEHTDSPFAGFDSREALEAALWTPGAQL